MQLALHDLFPRKVLSKWGLKLHVSYNSHVAILSVRWKSSMDRYWHGTQILSISKNCTCISGNIRNDRERTARLGLLSFFQHHVFMVLLKINSKIIMNQCPSETKPLATIDFVFNQIQRKKTEKYVSISIDQIFHRLCNLYIQSLILRL